MPTDAEDLAGRTAMLRHTLATLAYRGGKALRDAPEGFGEYRVAPGSRTPGAILAHVGDLLDWAAQLAEGHHVWQEAIPHAWEAEVARFFAGLERLGPPLTAAWRPLSHAPRAVSW